MGYAVGQFCQLAFGGAAFGIAAGIIIEFWLRYTHNNFILEINLTIFGSYLVFYLAETLKISGILALVTLGLYMTMSGKTSISANSEHALHHVWGYVGFVAETLIFFVAGLIMGSMLRNKWKDFK